MRSKRSLRRRAATARPADGTRERLVRAALTTLTQQGFSGTTARAIARTGKLNQALIFYHFGSVDRLLLAAL
ncbi:MAG: helix-turn-helix transcriptional regulator, partial [Chloroflexi bacterium]